MTMRRVAQAVGITPMAIYRHYPDRAGLLNALADTGFAELAARLARKRFPGGIEERLTKMAEIYLEHALHNPRLFELMFLKPREGARRYPRDFKAGRSPTANLMAASGGGGHEERTISAKTTCGRSSSRWARCPMASSCFTSADAWACLLPAFAPSTGDPSGGTCMAFVNDGQQLQYCVPGGDIDSGIGLVRHWPLPQVAAALVRATAGAAFRFAQFLAGEPALTAAFSWLVGSLNLWHYLSVVHAPLPARIAICHNPSAGVRGCSVALSRAAKAWRLVERAAGLPGDVGLHRIPFRPHFSPRHGRQSFLFTVELPARPATRLRHRTLGHKFSGAVISSRARRWPASAQFGAEAGDAHRWCRAGSDCAGAGLRRGASLGASVGPEGKSGAHRVRRAGQRKCGG